MQLFFCLYTFIYPFYISRPTPLLCFRSLLFTCSVTTTISLPRQYPTLLTAKKTTWRGNPHITLIQVTRTTKNTNFFRNFTSGWRDIISVRKSAEPAENTVKIKYNP